MGPGYGGQGGSPWHEVAFGLGPGCPSLLVCGARGEVGRRLCAQRLASSLLALAQVRCAWLLPGSWAKALGLLLQKRGAGSCFWRLGDV